MRIDNFELLDKMARKLEEKIEKETSIRFVNREYGGAMPIIVSASYFSKTQNYYQLAEVVYYPDALVLASEDIAKIRLEFPYSEPEFPGNYCKELLRLVDVLVPYIDENSR